MKIGFWASAEVCIKLERANCHRAAYPICAVCPYQQLSSVSCVSRLELVFYHAIVTFIFVNSSLTILSYPMRMGFKWACEKHAAATVTVRVTRWRCSHIRTCSCEHPHLVPQGLHLIEYLQRHVCKWNLIEIEWSQCRLISWVIHEESSLYTFVQLFRVHVRSACMPSELQPFATNAWVDNLRKLRLLNCTCVRVENTGLPTLVRIDDMMIIATHRVIDWLRYAGCSKQD